MTYLGFSVKSSLNVLSYAERGWAGLFLIGEKGERKGGLEKAIPSPAHPKIYGGFHV
jgi:hypothetical protein